MADLREEKEDKLDPKAVKKEEKARRKAEKKLEKQRAKKEDVPEEEQEPETAGGKVLIIFVTLLIVAVWLTIFALLIKWDVGGFGSSVLYPILKDVPYVNKILPEVADPEKEDPYAYDSMEEAVAQIKKLEKQLAEAKESSGNSDDEISELQDEVARLKVYEKEQADFEEIRTKFYEEVVFGDKAPDIDEYKTFYESINPENAEQLYKQVVSQKQEDEEIADYVKAYSEMKPKAAAAIMESMTDDLELVAKILSNMKADKRGDILAAMNSDVAASVTKLMEP
ncbi:MAG: MotE family protein [Lachnospiraceae bacterium]